MAVRRNGHSGFLVEVLAQRENQYLIPKIKAAITAGIRPCAMIFHEQPTDDWIPFDFLLLEAYQRLQDEICPRCGHPVWLCRSKSNTVDFKVQSGLCYAEKALKVAEVGRISDKKSRDAAKKELRHAGQFWYTVPYVPPNIPNGELPTRDDYYSELAGSTVE